jgi:hypothetical protein
MSDVPAPFIVKNNTNKISFLKQEQPGETGTLIWMGTLKNTTRSHMET